MQTQHLNSQYGGLARNLQENQLGGVIFGCKHDTIQECFTKQLFGLPSVHYSYVRNVKPGLPLFLFNYSDRKLHGIFEAASPGQMSIDPYAWSNDGSLKTAFPAQVRICTKTQYPPLLESQFKTVLGDNYYNNYHFYFELDHAQARALIALFKSLGPANFKQVQAVSSKRCLIVPLPSTERKASVIPDQKKGTANVKDINPFSVLSNSSGVVPDNWADSDAENGSISRTSHSNSDEKESGELVSDWEDLDDNVLHNQFGLCSNPDEVSQNSSYKTVAEGIVECSHLVVNPVNGVNHTCDEDMLVSSHDEHSGAASVDGRGSGVQKEPDGVGVQPERPFILAKLKELFVLRQQAALSSQYPVDSSPDQYAPEETSVNASPSSPDQYVPEETLVNASLSSPDQYVPEETPVNASLSSPDQYVPEETPVNASLSSPYQYVPEETRANANLSNHPFGATVDDNTSFEQHDRKAELIQIVTDLTKKTEALEKNQIKSDQEILSLKEVIKDSRRKVQQLEYRVDELQFKFDSSLCLLGSVCDNLDKPSIFLIGGYNGVTWLSSLDSFSPKKDMLVPLAPMGSARSYASVAVLEGCIFVFGGGDGSSWYNTVECYNTRRNEWVVCPCLNHQKGSLAGVSLNGKIYAIGGGDGTETYSEVEMFDPVLGKWICSPSMRHSRFALAAAELSGVIYVAGGYDGSKYLQSAERYDPREGFWVRLPSVNARRGCHTVAVMGEVIYAMGGYDGSSMVSSVETFDPRLNAWKMGDPMSNPRGYASAVTLDDSLFVIGGLQSNEQILDTVEVYSASSGWSVRDFNSIGKRSFASAVVM